MNFGIIFAMEEELNAFLKDVKVNNNIKIYGLNFYEVLFFNKTLYLVESGVGKVNAARTCQVLIDKFHPDYLINVGIAGGINKSLKVLDIVIGERLVQHDFDITVFNHPKGYVPKVGDYVESDKKLLNLAEKIAKDNKISYQKGVIASGDIFVTSKIDSLKIEKEFSAKCLEMEGASIAQVAYLSNIPFLIIRSISDILGDNNLLTYDKFLIESSLKIANFLKQILEKI